MSQVLSNSKITNPVGMVQTVLSWSLREIGRSGLSFCCCCYFLLGKSLHFLDPSLCTVHKPNNSLPRILFCQKNTKMHRTDTTASTLSMSRMFSMDRACRRMGKMSKTEIRSRTGRRSSMDRMDSMSSGFMTSSMDRTKILVEDQTGRNRGVGLAIPLKIDNFPRKMSFPCECMTVTSM